MHVAKGTERLLTCVALFGGLTLAPALSRADLSALTDPSEISGATALIDFEGLDIGEISDPNVLLADNVIFPDAPDGDFVVFLGDNRLIDVQAAPGGNSEIRILFDAPVAAAGIEYLTSTQLTFVAYSDEFATAIGSTTSVGSGGFFGIGVHAGDPLIQSVLIHDTLGSFNLDDLEFGLLSHTPAPGAVALGAIGLGLIAWVKRRLG